MEKIGTEEQKKKKIFTVNKTIEAVI